MNQQPHVEQRIERVLKGLGQAAAPAGMESRVQARLQHRTANARSTAWVWSAGLALAAALSLFAFLAPRTTTKPPVTSPAQARLAPSAPPLPVSPSIHAGTPSRSHAQVQNAKHSDRALASGPHTAPDHVLLASFPAPEAPLTDEERLLVRLASHGDLREFEPVDPQTSVREIAQNDAEFETFIHQSRPARNP